ncbi:MAG: DUF374 domain-containing protein [Silvanigrellales bacterium]|jgi:lysophospholipid acyltransferase (LPLAT)-like uncharacterized protein|nr:DUF374 domain-containing protein [Silvanigrellales bacterium]
MAVSSRSSRPVSLLISVVLRSYYLLLRKTCRFTSLGWENVDADLNASRGLVFATVHSVLLPAILFFDGRKGTFLASKSKDGELIAQVLESRGFEVIRGSSSRGGPEALELLKESVRRGRAVGVTFDGPRGPACKPKPGVGVLAWETGNVCWFASLRVLPRRVFPGVSLPFAVRLRSWDRFLLPLPFCHAEIAFERLELEPPGTPGGLTREEWIRLFLERLEARAREAYADVYG